MSADVCVAMLCSCRIAHGYMLNALCLEGLFDIDSHCAMYAISKVPTHSKQEKCAADTAARKHGDSRALDLANTDAMLEPNFLFRCATTISK